MLWHEKLIGVSRLLIQASNEPVWRKNVLVKGAETRFDGGRSETRERSAQRRMPRPES